MPKKKSKSRPRSAQPVLKAEPPSQSKRTDPAKPTQPDSDSESASPSMKVVGAILGGFALLSLVILFASWGGYQLNRHTRAAVLSLQKRDFADTAVHLEYITKRYPEAWMRLTQLGDCYLELDRPADALEIYTRSLELDSEDQDLQARLGQAHYLLGDGEKALSLLSGALQQDPNDPQANYFAGLIYFDRKEYSQAAYFFQGATSDPHLFEKAKPKIAEIEKALLPG